MAESVQRQQIVHSEDLKRRRMQDKLDIQLEKQHCTVSIVQTSWRES